MQTEHNFKVIIFIDRATFRQELIMHHTIVIEKKNCEQNLHIWPKLESFFSVLAIQNASTETIES